MKPKPILAWLIALTFLGNTGFNLFICYNLSRIYTINEDFRADITVRSIQKKIEADNIKLPPIKIIKFISAYPYAKPSQMFFTGDSLLVFVNLIEVKDLSELELEAIIAHEIGHHVFGHEPGFAAYMGGVAQDSYKQEIQADLFATKYVGTDAVHSAITKLVWDANEKVFRLKALEKN